VSVSLEKRGCTNAEDSSTATAPAMTGAATLVPDKETHLYGLLLEEECSETDGARMSGLTRPIPPFDNSDVVMPLEEKRATLSSPPHPPTLSTSPRSAGLRTVPQRGPSLPGVMHDNNKSSSTIHCNQLKSQHCRIIPTAVIMMTPFAVSSLILSVNGTSA
jgi:hypothetical protein